MKKIRRVSSLSFKRKKTVAVDLYFRTGKILEDLVYRVQVFRASKNLIKDNVAPFANEEIEKRAYQ